MSSSTEDRPQEASGTTADDDSSTDDGPPVELHHQARFTIGDEDDDEEVISTEGEIAETTLSDYGADVDDTDRETRLDRPAASEFGVDDRPTQSRRDPGEQASLVADVDDAQQTITGEDASTQVLFGEGDGQADTDEAPHEDSEGAASPSSGEGEESDSESDLESTASESEDTEADEGSSFYGVGAGRRETLAAIESTPRLEPIDSPEELGALIEALREIKIESYRTPPEETIEAVQSVYDQLPEEAQPHFVGDETLLRRINAARTQFNDYQDRLKRMKEMPSPVEAGPANYPADKAREVSRLAREAGEDLDERLEKVEAGARGARQRALEAIGSSVAEQNEQARASKREQMRAQLSAGDLVRFRNPRLFVGEVLRVNKKTVTVRYPNPRACGTKPLSDEPEPAFCETRVDLDSDFLEVLSDEDLPDEDLDVDAETVPAAQETVFGADEAA